MSINVTVKRDKFDKAKVDVLIVPVYQETPLEADSPAAQLNASLDGLLRDYLDSGDFSAALNSTTLLRTRGSITAPRVLLVGLGKPEGFTVDHLRQASASAATTVQKLGVSTMAMLLPPSELSLAVQSQAITEGALLGLYSLKTYKTAGDETDKGALSNLQLLAAAAAATLNHVKRARRSRRLARDFIMPRQHVNPPTGSRRNKSRKLPLK